MIQLLYRTGAGEIQIDLTPASIPTALQDAEGLLWVDFSDEPQESCEPILRQVFKFHPLAVDDALVALVSGRVLRHELLPAGGTAGGMDGADGFRADDAGDGPFPARHGHLDATAALAVSRY